MANNSWRHHYIPQFYLNEFTNDSGSFKIYDVENKRFIKNGKEFHPESFFFEENANTFLIKETQETNDDLEHWYSKIDNTIAEIFTKIRISGRKGLIDLDIAKIEYFIGLLYWRIPINYEKLCELVKTKQIKELGLVIKNDKGEVQDNTEIEKKLKTDEIDFLTKFFKFNYPSIGYYEITMKHVEANLITFTNGLPSICSDNPILVLNPKDFRVYRDEYIFPLNNKLIFFRGNVKPVLQTIKIEIDILTMKQANKYVSCTDLSYLGMLENVFQQKYRTIEKLREYLFNEIFYLT